MNDFCEELKLRIAAIQAQGLYRELRRVDSPQLPHIQIGGKRLLNFSSNDYLGLANDPRLKEAAAKGVERYGAGSGASRLKPRWFFPRATRRPWAPSAPS